MSRSHDRKGGQKETNNWKEEKKTETAGLGSRIVSSLIYSYFPPESLTQDPTFQQSSQNIRVSSVPKQEPFMSSLPFPGAFPKPHESSGIPANPQQSPLQTPKSTSGSLGTSWLHQLSENLYRTVLILWLSQPQGAPFPGGPLHILPRPLPVSGLPHQGPWLQVISLYCIPLPLGHTVQNFPHITQDSLPIKAHSLRNKGMSSMIYSNRPLLPHTGSLLTSNLQYSYQIPFTSFPFLYQVTPQLCLFLEGPHDQIPKYQSSLFLSVPYNKILFPTGLPLCQISSIPCLATPGPLISCSFPL